MGVSNRGGTCVYRKNYVRGAVTSTIGSIIAATALAFMIPGFLPVTTTRSVRAALALAAAAVAVILIWVVFLWLRNLRVEVGRDRVEVWRPFQRLHSWERAATGFTSVVTVHRSNGIQTATTRALVATSHAGDTTVDLPGFDRRTFNGLMAQIGPPSTSAGRQASAERPAGCPSGSR